MDAYVKIVLTVIAACLLLQVAQGFGLAGAPGPGELGPGGRQTGGSQYMMQAIPMARLLFRFDTATGRTWTMPMQAQQEKYWTLIEEAPPEPMAREEGAAAPARPDEAAPAEE